VKACPQNAIDVRGYADFAPMGHKIRVLREEEKGTISWKVKFRNGKEKNFVSPITTKPWGKHIPKITELEPPNKEALDSQLLCFEPDFLKVETGLPEIEKERFKQGVYY
jgi:adenylylsulfate reductase subunit B